MKKLKIYRISLSIIFLILIPRYMFLNVIEKTISFNCNENSDSSKFYLLGTINIFKEYRSSLYRMTFMNTLSPFNSDWKVKTNSKYNHHEKQENNQNVGITFIKYIIIQYEVLKNKIALYSTDLYPEMIGIDLFYNLLVPPGAFPCSNSRFTEKHELTRQFKI